MLNSRRYFLILGVLNPMLGSIRRQRKRLQALLVHGFVQLQQHRKACSRENGLSSNEGDVIVADVSNLGGSKSIRNQVFLDGKMRELDNFRTLVLDDGD